MQEYNLRPYQKECKKAIEDAGPGRHLAVLATGLGKTVVFTHLDGMGRTLLLSHRDELVRQPEKYYAGRSGFGVEKADEHAGDEEIVSASVQSLSRDSRLSAYAPDAFDTIIVDEAHHAAAPSYRKIINYFTSAKRLIGFTATPKRGDGVRLTDVFDDIIFTRDLRWGIRNGYLSRVRCMEVEANYHLNKVTKTAGDFVLSQLENVLENGDSIPVAAKTYMEHCHEKGRHTLIYCVTKKFNRLLLETIRSLLPDDEKETVQMVDGETPDEIRRDILAGFSSGAVRCIINCMVLTEGTDLPVCDTIINLRPTCNNTLYQQIAGRGTRLYDGKDYCLLIDIIPRSEEDSLRGLCTAPSLFGLEPCLLSQSAKTAFTEENDLLDVCDKLGAALAAQAQSISLRAKAIDLFLESRENLLQQCEGKTARQFADAYNKFRQSRVEESGAYDFGDLDVETQAEESRYYKISPSWNDAIYIGKPDVLDNTTITFNVFPEGMGYNKPIRVSGTMKMQDAVRLATMYCELGQDWFRYSWNKKNQAIWSKMPATNPQLRKLLTECKRADVSMTDICHTDKLGASRLIDLLMQVKEARKSAEMWRLADSQKNIKKVREAKAWAEQVMQAENKVQGGPDAFLEFADKVQHKYQQVIKARTAADAQYAKEAKAGAIDIIPERIPQKGQPITSSQESFAEGLKQKAERLGCSFPGLVIGKLTKRQASVLISFLIRVCDKARWGCGWEFPWTEEICQRIENMDPNRAERLEFPYRKIQ